jgi:hypothetical protein
MTEENPFESLKTFKFIFDKNDPNIISKHLGNPYPPDKEAKRNMSLAKKGKKNSPEHIERARLARIGAKQTEYQKQRARETLECAWIVTNPNGEVFNIVNLRKYCKENNLDQGNMVRVSQGILKQHKGWTCYKVV